jgi:hypothetical protein
MATQPTPAPKKSSLSVSRVVLLLILAGALASLGYDQFAKYRMGQAYKVVDDLNKEDEASNTHGLSKQKVHEALGREPTNVKANSSQDLEEYDFAGVFYIHRLTLKFRKGIGMYEGHETESIFRLSAK